MLFCQPFKKPTTNQKTRDQETKQQKTNNKKNKIAHPKGGVVFFCFSLFFLSFLFSRFLLFVGIWLLFSYCRKTNNKPENKKPRHPKNKKKKIAHPKEGSSGRELGLVILFFLVSWFCSRMRSEGFPLIWGSGGWTRVRRQLVGASFFASFSIK